MDYNMKKTAAERMRTWIAFVFALASCGHDGPVCLEAGIYVCNHKTTFNDCPSAVAVPPLGITSSTSTSDGTECDDGATKTTVVTKDSCTVTVISGPTQIINARTVESAEQGLVECPGAFSCSYYTEIHCGRQP